jgi:hypothetical protein
MPFLDQFSALLDVRLHDKRLDLAKIDTFVNFLLRIDFGGSTGCPPVDFGPPRSFNT